MSIFIDETTRVIVQGITGKHGLFHTKQMLKYGTKIVAGVTPDKGGQVIEGVPVFNTVAQAKEETGANASVIYVPARFAADAVYEAADAGVGTIVCITEGIPVLDMVKVKEYIRHMDVRLFGPNCPGLISPGKCKLGIMPASIHMPGRVGVVSRSGTLTYEAVNQLTLLGIGQSTAVGIGGDPVIGTGFIDVLDAFNRDADTDAVVMIGEIGGSSEEAAAEWIQHNCDKPVVAFIGGQSAPAGKRMGHAGAIISGGKGTAADKIAKLEACGVTVSRSPHTIGALMKKKLEEKNRLCADRP